ncbi:MAG: glycosyltransferase family 39 protein [Planctomycetaceae bacterium]|nr:glycosyltransferase family 39 protein [Planctomycetaceae bacterium]
MSRRTSILVAAVALAIHFGLAVDTARRISVTFDEYWHLPVGVLNASQGRFDFERHNPPLARMWCAIPVLLAHTKTDFADQPLRMEQYGHLFQEANPANWRVLYFHGRLTQCLLSVLIGVMLYAWVLEMFGDGAAALAALLWSFCPNILASASVVTTDLAACGGFVSVLYATWRFAAHPSFARGALVGFALGVALLGKFTAIILVPLAPICWGLFRRDLAAEGIISTTATEVRVSGQRLAAAWGIAFAVGLLVFNAGYLFRGTGTLLRDYSFESPTLRSIQSHFGWLGWLPLPVPRDGLLGIDQQSLLMQSPHPVFLDGAWSDRGFPHYYLMALLYKLPHPLQGLLCLAALRWIRPGTLPRRTALLAGLLIPAGLLILLASISRMQLGVRYVLPAIPLFIAVAAQAARWTTTERKWTRLFVPGLALLATASLRHHPHHIAYFNELAGGPEAGFVHLIDSNIDWGQDLDRLKEYVDANRAGPIGLAYFGSIRPGTIGLRYRLPPSGHPEPGTYAVSISLVMGRPDALVDQDGHVHTAGLDEYGYFRPFAPVARIGYSIEVYRIGPLDVMEWNAAHRR